jgi:arginyl-tRNA synthetase
MRNEGNKEMRLEEAKQILEENGYTLTQNLNESIDKRYLQYAIQDVADQLYEEELMDEQPEVDEYGNVNLEYFKRFEYTSPELRRACKRAATKLSNDLKESGIKINPWYCEMEIYDKLRYFTK